MPQNGPGCKRERGDSRKFYLSGGKKETRPNQGTSLKESVQSLRDWSIFLWSAKMACKSRS